MNLAIIGSRDFNDYSLLKRKVDEIIHEKNFIVKKIISGGARGADTLAERYARENSIPIEIIKPDWSKLGKKAGILRNTAIIEKSDIVIAFHDGQSPGTADSIKKSIKNNKQLFVIRWN